MDVNDVSNISSNLSALNDISSSNQSIGRTSSSSEVSNEKDSLRLNIAEYNKRRDELSASLQTFTKGIGVSVVAQNGLGNQIENLKNIQTSLTDIRDNNIEVDDKNSLKNDMNKELLSFRNEAFNTKYNNEKLLALDEYEERPSIIIDAKEAHYNVGKPNTPVLATDIAQTLSSSDLNNPDSLLNVIEKVDSGIKTMENIKSQFSELEDQLKQNAKDSIQEQISLSNENKKNKQTNFGKESNDFTKSNVMANMGYLAASQANIVQEQSVRLLS